MKILGIETSCDETSVALLEEKAGRFLLRQHLIASQIDVHKKYGGVVPEVAARKHLEVINYFLAEVLKEHKPDLIAVTYGPGLQTSLQVGVQVAKTLSYAKKIPLIGVNHLAAHAISFLLEHPEVEIEKIVPAVCLIISGGHTEQVTTEDFRTFKLLGRTRDDAVGEAFDKVAKIMNLGYPGGPLLSALAKDGDKSLFQLPRPMINSGDYDFSFSGLKTAVRNILQEMIQTGDLSEKFKKNLSASFQVAVGDVLVKKTLLAIKETKASSLILGGGVSANTFLQKHFQVALAQNNIPIPFYFPGVDFTGDNAAMVALRGWFGRQDASLERWRDLTAEPNLTLGK